MPDRHHQIDAVVVGAGFGGLYAAHELRRAGFSVAGFEAAPDVGGVWYWNRYPGARCDIVSLEYSFSFDEALQQDWVWQERYATQPEILAYLNHVADRFDLRSLFSFSNRVVDATWDTATSTWTVTDSRGDTWHARHVILAVGCLSSPKPVAIPGLDGFQGNVYHTSGWPHAGVDFTGQRVAVIGTGSSGIQSIPVIAQQAEQLFVLQRTAAFSVPAWNRAIPAEEDAAEKRRYAERRAKARGTSSGFAVDETAALALDAAADERERRFEECWALGGLPFGGAFADLVVTPEANAMVADFIHRKIRASVADPAVAELLSPRSFPFGTKRMCVDTNYYATFNRSNVELVDIAATPLVFEAQGVRVGDRLLAIDSVVMATGFDAMTGSILKIPIRGPDNTLAEAWQDGPKTLLGVMVAGFPNLFIITGPGSPSVLSNMVLSIEQHVQWITAAIVHLRDTGASTIAACPAAQEDWASHVNEIANSTLFPTASSWYMGANIPGKPRVFMPYLGGVKVFAETCNQVVASGYTGFVLA